METTLINEDDIEEIENLQNEMLEMLERKKFVIDKLMGDMRKIEPMLIRAILSLDPAYKQKSGQTINPEITMVLLKEIHEILEFYFPKWMEESNFFPEVFNDWYAYKNK